VHGEGGGRRRGGGGGGGGLPSTGVVHDGSADDGQYLSTTGEHIRSCLLNKRANKASSTQRRNKAHASFTQLESNAPNCKLARKTHPNIRRTCTKSAQSSFICTKVSGGSMFAHVPKRGTPTPTQIPTNPHTHIHAKTHVHTFTQTCRNIHTHISTHTHTHTHIYTHTRTFTHMRASKQEYVPFARGPPSPSCPPPV
jgi:hypothetical protein